MGLDKYHDFENNNNLHRFPSLHISFDRLSMCVKVRNEFIFINILNVEFASVPGQNPHLAACCAVT